MSKILILIFAMSIVFCSGCNFSLSKSGFRKQSGNNSVNFGTLKSSFATENELGNSEQRDEEFIKDQGTIFGTQFERAF